MEEVYLWQEELEFLTQQEDGVRNTDLTIYRYFALALKVLSVPQEYSNNKRKMIDGFGAKIRGEIISDFPCYLIGQLSRNSNVPEDSISGNELTEKAISVIKSSMISVGGRAVLVECRNKIIINSNLTEEEVFAAEVSLINAFNYVSDAGLTNIVARYHSAEALSVDEYERINGAVELKEKDIRHRIRLHI